MLYKLGKGCNAAEATKKNCWAKGEGKVGHTTGAR